MHSFSYSGNRRYPIFLLACLGALLIGCSGGGVGGGDGDDCSVRKQNRFVHLDMLDLYYWYDRVLQTIDYDDFSSPEETLAFLRHNARYQPSNLNLYLRPLANSLGLNEMTVITTSLTCSASEQIVSALQPYFSRVTTIGGASCGKPVGQNPRNFCDKTLVAVNFASFNAAGQGEYFSAIPADCSAFDDPGFAFGDPGEPLLQAARFFVDNNTCQPVPRLRGWSAPMLPGLQELAGAV